MTIWEAVITLVFFVVLIVSAFVADRIKYCIKKHQDKKNALDGVGNFEVEDFIFVINAKPEELENDGDSEKHQAIQKLYKEHFSGRDPASIEQNEIEQVLKPKTGLEERLAARNQFGDMISGRTTNGITLEKNQKFLREEMTAKKMEEEEWFKFNPLVGFRCLHYSVSEAIGKLKIHVINKVVGETFKVGIRTRDGTALAGDDFSAVDQILEFGADEQDKFIEVEILNDDCYEENEDFFVELYDPDNNQKLPGDDTETKITVIDDDQPGIIGFEKRQVTVHPKEGSRPQGP